MSLPAFLKSHGRPWLLPVVVSAFVLAAMVLMSGAKPASAANAGVAPPLVEHCNDSGATAGMELRCTIEIINYLNADGTLASSPASTVTITVCEAAESAGTAPCAAPITTTSLVPLTTARQCNAAYHGGGSWIECRVSIINYWATAPATVAATIFQCSGSVILG
ncbi:MAG: hypothetical protein DWG77_05315, partial [Chloroflexi bacterium]|nr:hypothetical protein [Chloroflexota bacterium]